MIFILAERTFAAASEGTGDLSTALIALCHHGVVARHIIAPDAGVDAASGQSACGRWLAQQGVKVARTLLMSAAERDRRATAVAAMPPEQRWQADMKEALEPKVGSLFGDDAVGWRPRWFDGDGSRAEFDSIEASLEERL